MGNDKKIARMKELIPILENASRAYYQQDAEIMSNYEYDALYDELVALEMETDTVLAGSPTVTVGYEVSEALPKERHDSPMLSLSKTKDRQELVSWLNTQKGLLSWKMDGLTVVLTYEGGELAKAVTRGNGEIGEVITANAKVFANIPQKIKFKGNLVLRGEAVITYSEFERINSTIEDVESRYKNPRNLCSGSVRQLDPGVTKSRNVNFFAFALVMADGIDFENSREKQFEFLTAQGFEVVEYQLVTADNLLEKIEYFEKKIITNDFPSDGLVLLYDDVAYGDSLGRTAKAPRNAIAFKWADETAATHLRYIEWSPSRTGLINPVAVFDPVELEGTTVTRASVHNISILKQLQLGEGDEITVYKANMIIPQIAENLTRSDNLVIPDKCPACQGEARIVSQNDTQTLICTNDGCPAREIKVYDLFTSRDALNVEGLSEQTLEKFLAKGFIKEYADIFHLDRYENEIKAMEGFGEKSFVKIQESIEKSRETLMQRFIYGLGIPGVGVATAKIICRYFDEDYQRIKNATVQDYAGIEGIGDVMAAAICQYFQDEAILGKIDNVLKELTFVKGNAIDETSKINGKVFVVTGSVEHFANRNELKAYIEDRGGKVTGSVTQKTDYLINNDVNSSSSKNKKAKELNIPILSEQDFLNEFADE